MQWRKGSVNSAWNMNSFSEGSNTGMKDYQKKVQDEWEMSEYQMVEQLGDCKAYAGI